MTSLPNPVYRVIRQLALLVLLTGCSSGMPTRPQPPSVSLTGLELVQLSAAEQQFRVRLQLHNPNAFALPIHSLNYALQLDGQDFAQGSSLQPTTVPALGDSSLELLVSSHLGNLIRPALLLGSGKAMRYDLSGDIALATSLLRIPFSRQGEISLR